MKIDLVVSTTLVIGGTFAGLLGGLGTQACVPAWLLVVLAGFAVMDPDDATEIVKGAFKRRGKK